MAIRPNYGATLRHGAWLARELARSALRRSTLEDVAAMAIVRAPNAERRAFGPSPEGEIRVDVGAPGESLALRVMDAPSPRGTVFVLHGIRDTKEAMGGWGAVVHGAGYRAVLVDLRGHGRSSGEFLTYGARDADDLVCVLGALAGRLGPLGPVGVMGHSYGASTAIQWAGRDPRITAIVAVAPFASLRDVVPGYLPVAFPAAFVGRAIARAGVLGGFDPDDASAVRWAANTRADVLFLHGGADRRVPPWHSERIRASLGGRSELVVVRGESHDSVAGSPRAQLAEQSAAWFAERLRAATA
jgi:alpha-beta hydrolase superfamily lysophospholipase